MSSDIIIRNAKVLTVDAAFSIAEAVAIKDGLIAAVGTNHDVAKWRGPDTQDIDAAGKTVIPGIIDAHPHLSVEGLHHTYRSLAGARSIGDILTVVAAEAAARKPGDWIVTAPIGDPPFYRNVPQNLREGRFPNRHDLDQAAPGNPVYIKPIWSWWNKPPIASVVNSAALKLLGITRETQPPFPGITIEKDQNGEPTGVLIEDSLSRLLQSALEHSVLRSAPRLTHEDRATALGRSLKKFNSVGTTSMYEGHGVVPDIMQIYRDYRANDTLTVRSYLVVSPPPQRSIAEYDQVMRDWAERAHDRGVGDAVLKIGGINIVWSGNAELAKLVAQDMPYTGYSDWHVDATTPAQYRDMVMLAAKHDLRVNTIASAQANVNDILGIFAEVNATYPIRGKRWVLQHLYELTAQNIAQMKQFGIVPTILPAPQLWRQARSAAP